MLQNNYKEAFEVLPETFLLIKKMKIDFVRFSSAAITPTQGTKDSAGFGLYSVEDVLVSPNSTKLIRTDIGFKIMRGYF